MRLSNSEPKLFDTLQDIEEVCESTDFVSGYIFLVTIDC